MPPKKKTAQKPPKKPLEKGKKRGGCKYTTRQKAGWRTAYEAGKYKSLDDLYADYMKRGLPVASVIRLRQLSAEEGWNKAAKEPEIREAMHEKYLRIAREKGLGDEELVAGILEMFEGKCKHTSDRNIAIQRLMDITGIKAPLKVARTDADGADSAPDTIFVIPANGFEPRSKK